MPRVELVAVPVARFCSSRPRYFSKAQPFWRPTAGVEVPATALEYPRKVLAGPANEAQRVLNRRQVASGMLQRVMAAVMAGLVVRVTWWMGRSAWRPTTTPPAIRAGVAVPWGVFASTRCLFKPMDS